MPGFTEFLQREMLENKTDEPAAILGGGGEEFETARASVSKCPLPSIGVVSFGGPDAMAFINALNRLQVRNDAISPQTPMKQAAGI